MSYFTGKQNNNRKLVAFYKQDGAMKQVTLIFLIVALLFGAAILVAHSEPPQVLVGNNIVCSSILDKQIAVCRDKDGGKFLVIPLSEDEFSNLPWGPAKRAKREAERAWEAE